MFTRGSRYANVSEAEITIGGRLFRFKRVRFVPTTRAFGTHTVEQGERLDHIAFQHYRDPERFWRICDANLAMWPGDLVEEPGATLLIPPSED
ncbi:hypothetical protein KJ567_07450 [Candidatus Bipolaricaulota bacterium]|nr:hypothetical protein [Candidatus Bipolaricaulota bacterium]